MKNSSIILFVYRRLHHTQKTVEALQKNDLAKNSDLYVFSDGPKGNSDLKNVKEVRDFMATVKGFRSVSVVKREQNLGLSRSITEGVTEVVKCRGRAIILEDDMVTSPYFLAYMNQALDLYEDAEDVISIHGYMYPIREKLPETFFLKGADCWGWATWKRGWDLFEPDGRTLLSEIQGRNLSNRFDMKGTYPYTRMLIEQIRGENDSWAIRWYASALIKEKLTLFPGHSLVHNIGMDSSGTHSGTTNRFGNATSDRPVRLEKIPLEEDQKALEIIARHMSSIRESPVHSLFRRVKNFLG